MRTARDQPLADPVKHGVKRITLALQGGGSHGAFTWGVLDHLLERTDIEVEAISGASAGAMNAAVFASGLLTGGRDQARQGLHDFWREVSRAGQQAFNPFWSLIEGTPWGHMVEHAPIAAGVEMASLLWSPYDNPFYYNALHRIVEQNVDFERLRRADVDRVFICATNVRSNERKVFFGESLCAEALLASSCIPSAFRTVEVDGDAYWDGGYMGNPVLAPLLRFCPDLVIVAVNPLHRSQVPTSARGIMDRLREITFNSSLIHEINTIETLNRLIESGSLKDPHYRRIHFHHISAQWEQMQITFSSKMHTGWDFLLHLRDVGRRATQAWLNDPERFGKVGAVSSYDVNRNLLKALRHERRSKSRGPAKA